MNSITRFVYGLLSTLMLAAGFVRAADRLDPMSNSLPTNRDGLLGAAASCAPCVEPCNLSIAAPCVEPCNIVAEIT